MTDCDRLISASLLRLRIESPFFATLALFARFVPSEQLDLAGTDGKDIFYNGDRLQDLPPTQQDGLLLHAVLHAALLHVPRKGRRDLETWNIAADIVVNGIIASHGQFELPPDAIREPALERLSVEEIYELLQQNRDRRPQALPKPDLLDAPPPNGSSQSLGKQPTPPKTQNAIDSEAGGRDRPEPREPDSPGDRPSKADLDRYWRNARQQAQTIAQNSGQGDTSGGLKREFDTLAVAQLDWRSYLWRYLVQTPTDFSGFDRRFIGQGLYLDALEGQSLQVFIAVDTSGSIADRRLGAFLSEVRCILATYPHIQGQLYYADAGVDGPYDLSDRTLSVPVGGGGTAFTPFFECVARDWDRSSPGVCLYFTDGYGSFPETIPELPVLWVVPPGARAREAFPFGEVVGLCLADC